MKNHEINTLFVCAFRYAIERKTYIAADIAEIIAAYKDQLSAQTKALIKKEIVRNEGGMDGSMKIWDDLFMELSK